MGSSFTEFRDKGFWCRDGILEGWLYLLSREVELLPSPPAWLLDAGQEWRAAAQDGRNGWISANLDEFLRDEDRVAMVKGLSAKVLTWLRSQGSEIPLTELNSWGCGGPGSYWTVSTVTRRLMEVGEAFLALLNGEILWDASSSPTLPTK